MRKFAVRVLASLPTGRHRAARDPTAPSGRAENGLDRDIAATYSDQAATGETGATLLEYGLIAALMAVVALAAVTFVGVSHAIKPTAAINSR